MLPSSFRSVLTSKEPFVGSSITARRRRCRRRRRDNDSRAAAAVVLAATVATIMSRFVSSAASFLAPSVLRSAATRRPSVAVVSAARSSFSDRRDDADHVVVRDVSYSDELTASVGGYARPTINWYPGHIAKAESLLSETLKAVDLVLEVRDARAPKATAHPRVAEWSGGRPRIVVLTKTDLVPKRSAGAWRRWAEVTGGAFESGDGWASNTDVALTKEQRNRARQAMEERRKYATTKTNTNDDGGKRRRKNFQKDSNKNRQDVARRIEDMLFVDAKRGQGIHGLHRAIWKAGQHVNERRARRGLSERALRVGVIGYPNVGKSALINRILGRRRARSANTPGVTRSLQWIRVRSNAASSTARSKEFELLDSPGIIPANMHDSQSDAMLLAACNAIGDAAYDNQAVAAFLLDWLRTSVSSKSEDGNGMGREEDAAPEFRDKFRERYGFDLVDERVWTGSSLSSRPLTGEEALFRVADEKCRGDPETASRRVLQDFRTGRLGRIALQFAPEVRDDGTVVEDGFDVERHVRRGVADFSAAVGDRLEDKRREEEEARTRKARAALETARERGLELPPTSKERENKDDEDVSAVGKGMFDGW